MVHQRPRRTPQTSASGRRYARALTSNADVRLTLAELAYDGHDEYAGLGIQQISWNRKDYEYVAVVHWSAGHEPLLLVQNRRQTRDQVLSVHLGSEASAGSAPVASTTVLEEHANDQWLDIIQGTPVFTPDGRLVCALNDMDADTNRLTVDGRPFTPAGWQVREVLDVTDEDVLAVVQRTPELDGYEAPDGLSPWRGNADGHDARSFDVVSFDYDGNVLPMTARPGSWSASRCGEGLVISGRDMDSAKSVMSHSFTMHPIDGGAAPENDGDGSAAMSTLVCPIDNHAAEPGFAPNVRFARLGEHRLYTAIIAPSADSPYAKADKLPVLLKPYGGPGFQQVVFNQAYYWDAQWWADQGFLVVTADGRGTTGRGPRWDREIFENMKDVTLADQVEAVHALAQAVEELNRGTAQDGDASRIPAPDLDKVCMIGWSYGASCPHWPCWTRRTCSRPHAPRPAHRLDAVRHALHRALSGPRPGCLLPKRHRAGRTETRAPAYADPRFRRRQRHHRPQPAPLASPDGGGSPAHLPAVDGHHPYDQ